ncbi:MAG: SpoIIE family protein phosphatase [Balneolaceae bacterium]
MLDRRSYILLLLGLAGLICYVYLRPHIDLYASGPISESKETVEERIRRMAPDLGFSTDSLAMMSVRTQNTSYINHLRDTLDDNLTLAELNERGAHIQTWKTVIGKPLNRQENIIGTNQLFENAGNLKIQYSNKGQIIRLQAHPENPNPTFIRGDSLQAIAAYLIGSTFNYNLDEYDLAAELYSEASLQEVQGTEGMLGDDNGNHSLEISWKRKAGLAVGPNELILKLEPVVREINNEDGFRTEFGFGVESFVAKDEFEPEEFIEAFTIENNEQPWFNYVFFISIFILAILIFSVGIRNIFKGKVEWRRALFMFLFFATALFAWRFIYFMYSYNPFLGSVAFFGTIINNLLFAMVVGLYGALAYISWESLARSQQQKQVDVIDALWQRKFFVSETGAGLIHGFAIGGIAIGIFSMLTYLVGEYLIQADSQFGFAEAGITARIITLNLSAWTVTWLVGVGQIGFVYGLINHWFKRKWISGLLTLVVVACLITVAGRLIGTSGELFEDALIYLGIAIIFVYAIKEFGLLTVCTGWWVFAVFFMIQPYWNSPSIDVAYVGWVQMVFMATPLIYGFLAYRYGISVSEVGDYIPEYEERIAQHLRVEREIEIARESQYKLMPLQPPKVDGIDVYGFFLPSFEVGGDYFDYVVSEDQDGKPIALTMAVVDVSGKAMRAAMPAVFTSGLLLSRMKENLPADILSKVSEPIFARTDKRTFITCVLARYDLTSQKISIANAGHCRPILKRNGVAEFIQTPDPKYPLGLKPDVVYKAQEFSLKKGDFFLMYSDGLPEAANEKGDRYGFEEVPRLIEQIDTDNLSAQDIAQEIKRTVQKFSNYQLVDDTTIICLKV